MNFSKASLLSVLAAALFLAGCNDSGSSAIADKWRTICEMEITATNCPEDMDSSALAMFCTAIGSAILDTEACNAKMDAYTECYAQREWACLEGGEVPMPVDPDPCSEEILDAFTLPSGECIDESKVSSN